MPDLSVDWFPFIAELAPASECSEVLQSSSSNFASRDSRERTDWGHEFARHAVVISVWTSVMLNGRGIIPRKGLKPGTARGRELEEEYQVGEPGNIWVSVC